MERRGKNCRRWRGDGEVLTPSTRSALSSTAAQARPTSRTGSNDRSSASRRRSNSHFFVPKFLLRAVHALAHRDLLLLAARHRYSALRLLKYACLSSPLSGLIGPRRAPLAGQTRVAGPVAACHQLYQPLGPLQPLRGRGPPPRYTSLASTGLVGVRERRGRSRPGTQFGGAQRS